MRRVDHVKGFLTILVIAGHLLLGERHASLTRWIIYSFHMPLFAAVSGYLFPWNEMKKMPLGWTFSRYWRRPILPWLMAVGVYALVNAAPVFLSLPAPLNTVSAQLLSPDFWSHLSQQLIHPFFHLWFIPAYLLWISLSWTLTRLRLSWSWIMPIGVAASLISQFLNLPYPSYYLFFVLGGFFRWHKRVLPERLITSPTLLLLAARIALFYYPNPILEPAVFFGLNVCLIRLMVLFMERQRGDRYPFLEWIGVNSLAIYLWHVLPLLLVYRLHFIYPWESLGLNALGLLFLFMIIRMTLRMPVANKLLHGI